MLKENEILKYKKNIFKFSITPLWHLWCADLGEFEESLIIKFKDGQVRRIDSYCPSKRFDIVVKQLRDINDSIEIKNRKNINKLVTDEVREKNGFEWVRWTDSINEEKECIMDKIIINKEYYFDEYTPFNDYLQLLMNEIKNKKIKYVFTTCSLSWHENYSFCERLYDTCSNLYVVLDNDMVINIQYYFYSIIYIKYMHINDFSDEEKELSEVCRYKLNIEDTKIVDYELESFHYEYEINPSTGETRPEGGDYFKQISFILDNDNKLCICAEDSEVDGYCDTWVEHI